MSALLQCSTLKKTTVRYASLTRTICALLRGELHLASPYFYNATTGHRLDAFFDSTNHKSYCCQPSTIVSSTRVLATQKDCVLATTCGLDRQPVVLRASRQPHSLERGSCSSLPGVSCVSTSSRPVVGRGRRTLASKGGARAPNGAPRSGGCAHPTFAGRLVPPY